MSDRPTSDNSIAAFPGQQSQDNQYHYGMTLRDYFAAQALPMLMQLCAEQNKVATHDDIAAYAYIQADAMLKAREG